MYEKIKGVVFLGDRVAEVHEFPMPRPGRGEVLIQLKRAAICGSDLHILPCGEFGMCFNR
jgi:threonine dehydrogenase-like Zn-dependent dehydrogenase